MAPVIFAEVAPWMIGILGAILGGGLLTAIAAYRKSGPEVESISVGTMKVVTDELRTEVSRMKKENNRLNVQVDELRRDIQKLRREFNGG